MNEPIKSGDECIIVNGATGPRCQVNLGRRVIVGTMRGEHSRFGRIWRCVSLDGKPFLRVDGCFVDDGCIGGNEADFASAWLQKAEPIPPGATSTRRELETS